MRYSFKTSGTCARQIDFDLEGNVVHNVSFHGGCNGNLQAISKVVEGMTVEQIEGFFRGIDCGERGTSCSDQLARGVRAALDKANAE